MVINVSDAKYCINCDWLAFSVKMNEREPELQCPEGYRLELLQGNNIYRNRFVLYDADGRKCLTALWSPYSSVLDATIMTVQAANWMLYSVSASYIMDLLLQIIDCEFNSVGRVDICCDFEMTQQRMEVLKHLNSGHYYIQGKKEGSVWWHSFDKEGDGFVHRDLHCLSWGSKKSEIKWKVYFKSREIGLVDSKGADCEKPYIRDEWIGADFDIMNVWRCEVSLSGASCLRYGDRKIGLDDCLSGAWLAQVFSDMMASRFVVRMNQGRRDGHKNKDKRIEFLPMNWEGAHLSWARSRDVPVCSDGVALLRRLMAGLENPVAKINTNVFEAMASAIYDVVREQRLEHYFERKFGSDVVTYLQSMGDDVGAGTYIGVDAPSKFYA